MEFLTPEEVATRCRVSTQTVLNWIHARKLPATQLSPRVYRVPARALERFLAASTATEASTASPPTPPSAAAWKDLLASYEERFQLPTVEMLQRHAEGRDPVHTSPEDEAAFGMWFGAAQLAVAAGLIDPRVPVVLT